MNAVATAHQRDAVRTEAFTKDPLWYKDAVIYQLHLKSYFDANGDGIGDFAGLIEKLDYISELGVNTIWLLPFYPSPLRDDGYDISEYRGVHPDYGRISDARLFLAEAHRRKLRVITELVINHTSDQHPWFQRARHAKPGTNARNFYVWSDTDARYAGTRIIFVDTEKSNWTWDPVANAYYWHRFYSHQPDLNFENPHVMKAVLSVMRFWLDLGVDGLRLDAVPYLCEREGTNNENLPETHAILQRIRMEIEHRYPDRMLLAEVNQWPEYTQEYFGKGDECHMAFHFPLMPRMYMALAQEDRFPITDILRQTPDIPDSCQWAIFLRNHDELTLEMVTNKERDYLWEKYASDRRARLNLGIRRRLAPLVERDRRRIELLNSLLLSMPGTPVLYYGDEIGMGDNIYLGDRDGVRTPMQWSFDRNGGYSKADPATLVLPPNMDPLYGYQAINVEAQSRDPHSLLNWTRRMLRIRKRHQVFGRGDLKLIYPTNRHILAYLRSHTGDDGEDQTVLCVANVSRTAQAVELDLVAFEGRVPVEMIGGSAFPPVGRLPYLLTVPPYGFYWFLLTGGSQMPPWYAAPPEPLPDYVTIVLRKDLMELMQDPARPVLEREALPNYLQKRRWFSAKNQRIGPVTISSCVRLPNCSPPVLLTEIEMEVDGVKECFQLPLSAQPDEHSASALQHQLALARLRRGARVGWLTDAMTAPSMAHGVLRLLRAEQALPTENGELQFHPTSLLAGMQVPDEADVRMLAAEQSNSSLVVDERIIIKVIRRIRAGLHPEAEMGRVLTERGFANTARLLGEVVHVDAAGTPHLLMLAQEFLHNQGDAWSWALRMVERSVQDADVQEGGVAPEPLSDAAREFAQFASILGKRIGHMHVVLAQSCDDPAFAPERAGAADVRAWAATARARVDNCLDQLAAKTEWARDDSREMAQKLLHARPALHETIEELALSGLHTPRFRIHGDLHLGQVLISQEDAYVIDFEGEPGRPLAERRAKTSPFRDVAGMLNSFEYVVAMAMQSSSILGTATGSVAREVIERFREISSGVFLSQYRLAAAPMLDGLGEDAEQALTALFVLERAAYEVCYELANRPTWLRVPLRYFFDVAQSLGTMEKAHA